MSIAQRLYEGADTPDGHVGLITYMRTDSTAIAGVAMGEARDVITGRYRAGVRDAEGPRLQDEGEGRPGSPRVNPPDQLRPDARHARGLAQGGRTALVPADLAAGDRLADGGKVPRDHHRRARRRPVRAESKRDADAVRRILAGLHRGSRRRSRREDGGGGPPAGPGRGRSGHRCRGGAHPAFHGAAAAIHGGVPGQGPRGARDRPPVHVRRDALDDRRPRATSGSRSDACGRSSSARS